MQTDSRLLAFERLLNIMDELREKCPWDKKQTLESLRHLTIEETYELSDAILENNPSEIKKELGDLFLHLVFYSKIATENKQFTLTEVLDGICEKLISRHPHIYDIKENQKSLSEEDVKKNWEKLKLSEGNKSVLSGVPRSLPPLEKTERMLSKVQGIGFDFDSPQKALEKVEEEFLELKSTQNQDEKKEELGDLLFSLVAYGKKEGINPTEALILSNEKFKKRFEKTEELINQSGLQPSECSKNQWVTFYNQSKELLI